MPIQLNPNDLNTSINLAFFCIKEDFLRNRQKLISPNPEFIEKPIDTAPSGKAERNTKNKQRDIRNFKLEEGIDESNNKDHAEDFDI